MLTKRLIACLDVQNGRTVKGTNFVNLRDAGDPVALAARYAQEGIDELVLLDITATVEKRRTLIELVRNVYDCFLTKFPLFFGYWKKYADLEFAIGGTETAEMVRVPTSAPLCRWLIVC